MFETKTLIVVAVLLAKIVNSSRCKNFSECPENLKSVLAEVIAECIEFCEDQTSEDCKECYMINMKIRMQLFNIQQCTECYQGMPSYDATFCLKYIEETLKICANSTVGL